MEEREKYIDICVSDYIITKFMDEPLFLSNNHPSNKVFLYMTNQIFKILKLDSIEYCNNWSNIGTHTMHYDNYNISYYNLKFNKPNNILTRNHLIIALQMIHNFLK